MKLCTVYGTTIRVHPLFPLTLAVYILAGQGLLIAAYMLALLLHEAGHWFAAERLRLPVEQIELTPFGGVMQITQSGGLAGRQGFLLACAGVAVNALSFLGTALLLRRAVSPFAVYFALANLSMLMINLLPALPLDGGRMVMALLSSRFPRAKLLRAMLLAGRILAVSLILCACLLALRGQYRPGWMVLGCYLLYASALEEKHSAARYIAALFSRRYRADAGEALPVQVLCATGEMPLRVLLPQLNARAYHIVAVLDDRACSILGTVTEQALYDAVLHRPEALLKQLLKNSISPK